MGGAQKSLRRAVRRNKTAHNVFESARQDLNRAQEGLDRAQEGLERAKEDHNLAEKKHKLAAVRQHESGLAIPFAMDELRRRLGALPRTPFERTLRAIEASGNDSPSTRK